MKIDRTLTCPMLVKVETLRNSDRSGPVHDVYVWKDTTLEELTIQVYILEPSSKPLNTVLQLWLWQIDPINGNYRNKFMAELRKGIKNKASEYRLDEFGVVAGDLIRVVIGDNEVSKENHHSHNSMNNLQLNRRSRSKSPRPYHRQRHYR